MNRSPTTFDGIRNGILLVLVVVVSILFGGFILGPIIAILFYLFQRYYKRSKLLERQLADLTSGKTPKEGDSPAPLPSSVPPPPPTDA
jgi:uncharacterized membrane protein YciS (DUF1049 family)